MEGTLITVAIPERPARLPSQDRSGRPFTLGMIAAGVAAVASSVVVKGTAETVSVQGVLVVVLTTIATAVVTLLAAGMVYWSPRSARWASVLLASTLAGLAMLSIGLLIVGGKQNPGASNSHYGRVLALAACAAVAIGLVAVALVRPWRAGRSPGSVAASVE